MKEDAFRAFLTSRLRPHAVSSYLANLRAVERRLHVDLDADVIDDSHIVDMREALIVGGMPIARARDCASALRQYVAFQDGAAVQPRVVKRVLPAHHPAPPPRFVAEASVSELMRLYADVLGELRAREITRTANGPVGDYAEWLFARAFGWTLAGNSAAHHDATDTAKTLYQIKGRRIGDGPGARQLGALRRLPEAHFHVLAAVLFDRDMQVLRAALIPHSVVLDRAKRVEATNSWRFTLSDAVWTLPAVRDATEALRTAAGRP